MPVRRVETPSGILVLDEELGYVRITNKRGVPQSLDDAKANIKKLLELAGDTKRPILVDLEGTSLPREVRSYYANPEIQKNFLALGLLVSNSVERVIANFWLALWSRRTPTRLFTSEEEASTWLRSFL